MMLFKYCFLLVVLLFIGIVSLRADENFETVEAVAGQSVELPCNMTSEKEADKLNVLAWYKNGSRTAIYSRDFRDDDGTFGRSDSARYRLVEAEDEDRLQILNVRASDSGLYYCFADFAASPAHKTHVNLVVIDPPQRVWVVHENGSRVATASAGSNTSRNLGPYYVGDTLHLFCVVYGGKPQPALTWRAEQRLLKNSSTPLSEQRVRSDLIYGPLVREDHGLVFTCSASNNDKITPLVVDITIDMLLPPELVSIRSKDDVMTMRGPGGEGAAGVAAVEGAARARAGDPLSLQCRVLGSRPLPDVIWRLNDGQLVNLEQKITLERSQRLSVSEVQLSVSREDDEATVTCCAPAHRRDVDYVCANPLPLTVVFRPVLKIIAAGEVNNNTVAVVKGSSIVVNCTYEANPSIFELIWYHEDEVLTKEKQTADSRARALVEPTLRLSAVSERDAGEYVCAASNEVGSTTSDPLLVDVTYPPYCKEPTATIYGVGENEPVNLTCHVVSNPAPTSYRWVVVKDDVNTSTLRSDQPCTTVETDGNVLLYQRSNDTAITTIFCWGINDVNNDGGALPTTPCTFHVSDETAPAAPTNCAAVKNTLKDITVNCEKGHDGGLPQKFMFTVVSLTTGKQLMSITNLEPQFIIPEPADEDYNFIIISTNEKGDSNAVELRREEIVDQTEEAEEPVSAMPNITTLSLSLCGGVALLALAACGLVLCARDQGSRADRNDSREPALHAYNTEESNCETCNDSDEGSEYNVRRTESFRRAVTRYPSRNFDVRRTSSFHSARCINDVADEGFAKTPKHTAACRVHSMNNIHRKREMDSLCDNLAMHLPPEPNYNVPRPVNTFYTMPRKMRHKLAKELSDETSEITQNSDGFSLPPPPDEFGTYKAASRISAKDVHPKTQVYATVRKTESKDTRSNYNNVIISPMNTVGLPTISGGQSNIYAYPDEEHQVNNNPFESD